MADADVQAALDLEHIPLDGADAERDRCFGPTGGGLCEKRRTHHHIQVVKYLPDEDRLACADCPFIATGSRESVAQAWTRHQAEVRSSVQVLVTVDGEEAPERDGVRVESYTREVMGEHTEQSIEDAFDLLAQLKVMQDRCTCAITDVLACPNYAEGDEELDSPARVET